MYPNFRSTLALALAFAHGSALSAADAVILKPLEGAPYSASATISPYASKAFLGTHSGETGAAALASLEKSLELAGLAREHVAYARASLSQPEEGAIDMAAWNADWGNFFGNERPRPTRTTLSAASLPGLANGVLVEAVAAVMPASDKPAGKAKASPFNNYIQFAGEGLHDSAAIAIVAPGAPLFFSSGTLADVADSKQPEGSVARFGSMETQTASTFRKLERSLAERGFRWEDVFYVRALLSPDPAGGGIDVNGFGSAFEAAFPGRHPSLTPTLALVAGPGFNATGRLVEIEVYAVAAEPQGPFATHDFSGDANPWVALVGNPESQISSSATVARYRSLTWFSGIVGTSGATMHDQSVAALLTLRTRMSEAGLGLGDAFQLRAYPVVGDSFRLRMDEWNEAYSRFFNHTKLNPHKPARTAFPLVSLPGDNRIEIEVIATSR